MKALIAPNESFTHRWISSWTQVNGKFVPIYSEITNCARVAETEPDNKIFEVAQPLYWVDCPEDCKADEWYYKDGQVQVKPQDVQEPQGI